MHKDLLQIKTQEQAVGLIEKICSIDFVSELKPEVYLADEEVKSLRALTQEMGSKKLLRILITGIIENFLTRFNKGKDWTTDMVIELADIFISEYPHYKLQDVQLFFYKAKRGHFGKDYNRLDFGIIFQWLAVFDNQRTDVWHGVMQNRRIAEIHAEDQKLLTGPAPTPEERERTQKLVEEAIHNMKVKAMRWKEEHYPVGEETEYMKRMKEAEAAYRKEMEAYLERKSEGKQLDSSQIIFYKHEFSMHNNHDRFVEKYFLDHWNVTLEIQTKSSKV